MCLLFILLLLYCMISRHSFYATCNCILSQPCQVFIAFQTMANSVHTAEGIGNILKQWLIENELTDAAQILQQKGITLQNLTKLASDLSLSELQYVISACTIQIHSLIVIVEIHHFVDHTQWIH